jgi:histidinol dehydrogenase
MPPLAAPCRRGRGRLATLERRAIAGASWRDFGAIITRDLAEAAALSNRVAPEHLELLPWTPRPVAADCPCRGDLSGPWTPEAIGDYVGGPNHVLPTARSARFSSGPLVLDFMKRTTLARMTPEALKPPSARRPRRWRPPKALQAHGLSRAARLDRLNR